MNLTYDTEKLPRDYQRPGVFISIGPSGFTAAGLGKSDTRAYIFTFLRSTTEAFALRSSMGCVENTHIEVRSGTSVCFTTSTVVYSKADATLIPLA